MLKLLQGLIVMIFKFFGSWFYECVTFWILAELKKKNDEKKCIFCDFRKSDIFDYDHFYYDDQFNNAHNIYIDEKGCVYLFGGNFATGGALMFDISQDPESPVYLGVFDDYYLHDGMARGDTLWGSAILEGVVAPIDVSDKSNPVILGSALTPNTFTHNSWVSDDGNYVFTTDEVSGGSIAAVDVTNENDMMVMTKYNPGAHKQM